MILSAPQHVFLNVLNTKYRAFVGGFGSGKTYIGCLRLLIFMLRHPGARVGYFAPTYPTIRDVFFTTFEEAAQMMGLSVDIKEGHKEIHVYGGGRYYGTVICRSMERPGSIVGFKISDAVVDELDTLATEKARQAWTKIIARLRFMIPGVVNGIGVTTTPEGYRFVYSRFCKDPQPSYSMVQASTYENLKYLPDDYVSSLLETYPAELVRAYLHGEFTNLTSGSVYRQYDREKCRSSETIQKDEPLFVGQDFNVRNMASVIYVRRGAAWHVAGELVGLLDTPDVIRVLKDRYSGHRITIYPDASGGNHKSSDASRSDITLLRQAGFVVRAKASNPPVKDRVIAVNKAFENGVLWINDSLAPETASCAEQQAYDKNGEPDKKTGHDHQVDAMGYPIAYEMPVTRPTIQSIRAF